MQIKALKCQDDATQGAVEQINKSATMQCAVSENDSANLLAGYEKWRTMPQANTSPCFFCVQRRQTQVVQAR